MTIASRVRRRVPILDQSAPESKPESARGLVPPSTDAAGSR
ncbi:MAG: hypothetical protein AVDCRST_MAG69-2369 [uncultured Solirubrobacteraceae bacterium]|uniref:Uncharacterized protein n=1 Tax=uncultured Solirubrobacteraceae bacterium TaxID=1162706 RepID=A0A6J4SZ20_9ACTN|nr:MAG: hypothetical protein AVDCRST_MAG69-2369 [uncultured Solirubrobacteraceae bacterium]